MIRIRHSLVSKLIFFVGAVLLVSMAVWASLNIRHQRRRVMENIVAGTDRLTNTVRLGAHYAMMLNSRDDITQIITNIGRQPEIKNIRIYNKQGQIKFSNRPEEVDQVTNIKAEACDICHRSEPPLDRLSLDQRVRIFRSDKGYRLLGIITPIVNEPACSTGGCHFHPADKKILGALDLVVSLADVDREIAHTQRVSIGLSVFVFLVTSTIILVFLLRFVNRPIRRLIAGTDRIARGHYDMAVAVDQEDEMGQLAEAINRMSTQISLKQAELNKQRDEYQRLFEGVPCLITVQDRNYRLVRYNRLFEELFHPREGDFCYAAYKGLDHKCEHCPVEKTFQSGQPHWAEESGVDKDGALKHWIVRSSPVYDEAGQIVAVMEISLDITARKQLELDLEKSEQKYHAIFDNIPNPVFVLDPETLEIMDANHSVELVYGCTPAELIGRSFLDLFAEAERQECAVRMRGGRTVDRVRQRHFGGGWIIVDIRISPAEYAGRQVLLVTTSDITKRLEAEQQLIQASKMATLGEMATGVAHELNQPLSVIKTVSSFFMRKLEQGGAIDPAVLDEMLRKVDRNVDRASKIINHMRQFARKSDQTMERVQINQVVENALDIFSQQLKVRGIEVARDMAEDLPPIMGDPGRLEQVFINLLLNARDAIEEKAAAQPGAEMERRITLHTARSGRQVVCQVCDTGIGLAPEMADKVFEPFFTTKEVGKGTGLGLSISYGIVKECGGAIRAVSRPGTGACFEVTFPVEDSHHDGHER
ncbi:MAG: PAS domain-containing sensor histidine kinase [Deltaproteobacteria bacterium]|nr:MAG: PAS domain-containing sensor histidine kinase [Deltaproteobacteria bacterium]